MPYSHRIPNTLKKGKKLNTKEESEIFEEYLSGNKKIEKKLVENYFFVVFKVAIQIKNKSNFSHFLFEDLIQEGTIGLIKAIQTYQPKKEIRFFFYARRVIKGHIYNALKQKEATVRIPNNIYRDVNEINKNIKKLLIKRGGNININEIALLLNLSKRDTEKLLQVFQKNISLDTPIFFHSEMDESTRYDIMEAKNVTDQFSALIQKERIEKISEAMKCLDDQEKKVLILRFGLLGRKNEMTLEKIGKKLNVSKQRIKQVEKRALDKIKYRYFKNQKEDFL